MIVKTERETVYWLKRELAQKIHALELYGSYPHGNVDLGKQRGYDLNKNRFRQKLSV